VVGGSWPRGAERTFQRSVLDPAGYAAAVLRLQLASLGIEVKGGARARTSPMARTSWSRSRVARSPTSCGASSSSATT
jgi:D-alanyl-D-alanine carboxypeptidase